MCVCVCLELLWGLVLTVSWQGNTALPPLDCHNTCYILPLLLFLALLLLLPVSS